MKNKIQKVVIGKRAQQQFETMRADIEQRYGQKTANKFVDDFTAVKDKLKKTPNMFEVSKSKPEARRGLFSKYGAFLYRVYANLIRVVTFFDTRSNKPR